MRSITLVLAAFFPALLVAQDAPPKPADTVGAIDRGLAFLAKDALAWKAEHDCASCHHAALIALAMREAKGRGHAVDEPVLKDLLEWMAKSGSGKTSLPRPEGRPKALNTKPVFFGLALGAEPEPSAEVQSGLQQLLETVKEDQTENGSWVAWPETRPPIFGPSDDTTTSLATLALLPAAATDARAKAALDKAVAWLDATKCDGDPQSVALRLVLWQRLGRPAEEIQPLIQRITERQNADGGWSQTPEMASDAWATGQALYALAHGGLTSDDPIVARGHAFLVKSQRDDGSWAMTSRPCPPTNAGATNLVPITGGGSSWAVLGLVKSQPSQ